MGYKDDSEGYCHFCAHYYTAGLQEVFAVKIEQIYFYYQLHKVHRVGRGDWWVRLIIIMNDESFQHFSGKKGHYNVYHFNSEVKEYCTNAFPSVW